MMSNAFSSIYLRSSRRHEGLPEHHNLVYDKWYSNCFKILFFYCFLIFSHQYFYLSSLYYKLVDLIQSLHVNRKSSSTFILVSFLFLHILSYFLRLFFINLNARFNLFDKILFPNIYRFCFMLFGLNLSNFLYKLLTTNLLIFSHCFHCISKKIDV